LKIKLLMVSLIMVLLFSAFCVESALADECPTCHGTGKIVCPECKGTGKIASSEGSEACPTCQGSGVLTPTITNKGTIPGVSDGSVFVRGSFQNEEDVAITANVTAEVESSFTKYTSVLPNVEFPPHETISVTVTIEGISSVDYQYFASQRPCPRGSIYVSGADEITCPTCEGTGVVSSLTTTCPECDGTGFVVCPDCGGSGVVGGGQNASGATFSLGSEGIIVGVAVVAAVFIVAVLVVKKRRVTEGSLRKLSSSEFQDWVVQRLSGTVSSTKDSRLGIDGYTSAGYPIQIEQSDDIGRDVIDRFATAMGQSKTRTGMVVAFSFGSSAFEGTVRAKLNYRVEIKTVTVKELLENRYRAL
jgi:hypothetical protein